MKQLSRRTIYSNVDGDEDKNHEARVIEDDGLPKDYQVKKLKTEARRLDTMVKKVTGWSISTTEKAILSGCVRINEDDKCKKATLVEQDDEIDIWESAYEENDRLANVKRVQIHSLILNKDGYHIIMKFWKNLLVDNWKYSK
uniref:RNA-binding S4 domain-containing protein n=1 Tax=Ditylenchus dipsaci TaxID=166011 RepID=A0A915ELI7_9BILA